MGFSRVMIVDGYTDEPAGFGVPPYLDVYPRYIAGALWSVDPSTTIHYVTVDQVRGNVKGFIERAESYDLVVVIAGAVVPGRYLGGTPISLEELKTWFRVIGKPFKVLVGAAARWGVGNEGGSVAALPREVRDSFDVIVTGDPEAYIYELARSGVEKAEPWRLMEDMGLIDVFAVKGARIVEQHPNHGYNLVAELETYRSCSRWISGGCSFCVTKLYGRPRQRSVRGVVREVEALYSMGVRHFRLGRQADILVYGSEELEAEEWPKPSPESIERLFYGIRVAAPALKTLHIDNVNPGTIVRHEEESREVLKTIIRYHTPGDVAAMGVETADPRVVKINNLKTMPWESFRAIRLVHELGRQAGYTGLPEMLAGINFVLGLPGETRETYRLNAEFIEKLYESGIDVRRINVRKVLVLPGTRLWREGLRPLRRHEREAARFKRLALSYSARFLARILPPGSLLRGLYVERYEPRLGVTFARQAGSYPVVAEIPCKLEPPMVVDVVVYAVHHRSVRAVPVPLDANRSSISALSRALGSRDLALRVAASRPFRSRSEIEGVVGAGLAWRLTPRGLAC